MARGACEGPARHSFAFDDAQASGRHEVLALLDAADGHVGDESRSRICLLYTSSSAASTDDQGVLNGVAVGDIDGSARRELNLPRCV